MPADFLNAEQRASFGQFSGEPNDIQLARFFLLDEVDKYVGPSYVFVIGGYSERGVKAIEFQHKQ